jgi:dsRNA-specific ribonuclease
MASEFDCTLVEQAIGYQFQDKKLLQEALTAAGAEGDGHDGNKHLASVGQAAVRLVIADSGYTKLMPRG